jgi:hypothetical protein
VLVLLVNASIGSSWSSKAVRRFPTLKQRAEVELLVVLRHFSPCHLLKVKEWLRHMPSMTVFDICIIFIFRMSKRQVLEESSTQKILDKKYLKNKNSPVDSAP